MTYAGSYAYISPQVVEQEEYTNKTDVWSVGWVFYNVMTLEFPNFNRQVSKLKLDATKVPIPNDGFKPLRDCICSKMIVPEEDERSSIDDVIEDCAFRDFYHLTEAKAVSWTYQEAIDKMSDRLLDAKQVQLTDHFETVENRISSLSEQVETTDHNLQNQINGLTRQVETAVQLVTNFAQELERKQVQIENEVAEREKLQTRVEELANQNKELQRKLNLSLQQRQQQQCQGDCQYGSLPFRKQSQSESEDEDENEDEVVACDVWKLLFYYFMFLLLEQFRTRLICRMNYKPN